VSFNTAPVDDTHVSQSLSPPRAGRHDLSLRRPSGRPPPLWARPGRAPPHPHPASASSVGGSASVCIVRNGHFGGWDRPSGSSAAAAARAVSFWARFDSYEMLRTIDRQDHNVSIQNRDAATCRGETRAAPPDCLTARATISEPLIAWTIPARDPKFRVRSAAPTPQMWAKDGSENRLGKKRSGKGRPVSRKRFSTFKTRPTLNIAPSSDHCS